MKQAGVFLAFIIFLAGSPALAQDGRSVEVNGFLLGDYSGRTTGLRPAGGGDFLLGEERLRLDINAWSESIEASARIKVDLFRDAVAGRFDLDLREAYADYTTGDFDFRLGRQIVTWGVGDLLFINDVFPKDWVSFFSGRPLEYLKIGVDGLRTRFSSSSLNAEMLVIPFFTPDALPAPGRFILFDPFAGVPDREEILPRTTYENTEFALRLYGKIEDFDVSAYAYRGFWRAPGMEPDDPAAPARITAFYSGLAAYGMSAQGSALGGIVALESGYYLSLKDRHGDDPSIPNSQARFLAGYQRQFREDFTMGVQYYAEIMRNHPNYKTSLPPGFPVQREYRDTITLRLQQLLKHQTWTLSLFAFYSPADGDYLAQPYASYKFSDDLSAALGANIFGGEKDTTFLGQFDGNDNVYLSVRIDF